jgi:hypothetical protein
VTNDSLEISWFAPLDGGFHPKVCWWNSHLAMFGRQTPALLLFEISTFVDVFHHFCVLKLNLWCISH